ncbi:hypothetical protein [Pararobbsia alpina]|uniref:Lipoprotein n=1 Tax=Pararobbsia alpina TaxID=621374 RepID=A0A6S7BJD0_9BURK|nr:hypothetical protein [Pararobbsia alpina]CAB3802421.1 hypothetical protein LMG28138_05194 [Pararobbsia alpina]
MTATRNLEAPRAARFDILRRRSLAAGLACAATLLAAACNTTSTKQTYLPSGDVGFTVNCSGDSSGSSWAACYKEAGEACGAYGYDVVSKDGDGGAPAGGSLGGMLSSNVKNRSMLVRCKQ